MKFTRTLLAVSMLFGSALTTADESAQPTHSDYKTVIAEKTKAITPFDVQEINETESGLVEIITNKGILYSTADGKYLFSGQLHAFEDGLVNLTKLKKAEKAVGMIDNLRDQFITYEAENQKHEVVVFFDTTCGFCRKMHSEMASYNEMGITVHYAIFPRNGIYIPRTEQFTPSYLTMQSVVCAPDKQLAMDLLMAQQDVPSIQCQNEIEASYDLGNWLGVRGTPQIYGVDGKQLTRGYAPAADLLKSLESQS
ncbi:MAG: thioredoxin fold domain-containing protein [Alteromonadaceae bacterium]|nr:thioredoxin fold domain-containing protein [Alteromonadaceae bacterium]